MSVAKHHHRMTHKRSLLKDAHAKPTRAVQHLAIDDFGELAERKRHASKLAREHGHDLSGWHRRPNDPAGRWNAHCHACNRMGIVCTETPDGFPDIYGEALSVDCATPKGTLK